MVYSTPLIAQNPLTNPASRNKISHVEKATFPYFSIQVVALKDGSIDPKFFKHVEFVREFPCTDGYNRYVVGRFETFEAANLYLLKLRSLSINYKGAFVVNTADFKIKISTFNNKPIVSTNSTSEKTTNKSTTVAVSPIKSVTHTTTKPTSTINRLYIDGILTPIVVKECDITTIPKPVNTSAALELLGVRITNICYPNTTTPDQSLLISSNDTITSKYPITIARTYTVKNACGNIVTKTQIISVEDKIKPVIVGEIKPVNVLGCRSVDFPAPAETVAELEKMGIAITDNCTSDEDLKVGSADGPVLNTSPKTVIRLYIVKDTNGNIATTSQTFIIEDTQNPIIKGTLKEVNILSCIVNSIPEAVKTIAELKTMGVSVSDNCTPDNDLILSSFDGTRVGNFPVKIIRTYTIKDASGNSSSTNQTFNITDNVNPTITGTIKASIISGDSEKNAPIAVRTVSDLEALGVLVSDNCTADPYLVVSSADEIIGKNPIIISRTYTIKDVCGNQAKTTHKITIIENKITPKVQDLPINTALTNKPTLYSKSTSPYLRRITHADKATSPYFAIQIVALKDEIKDPAFFKFVQYIREFSCVDGYNRYVVGRFETFEEASDYLSSLSLLSHKYKAAFVVNTANFKLKESITSTKPNSSTITTTATKTVTSTSSKPVSTTKKQLIDGILSPIIINGCSLSNVPKPVNTSSALELLGLRINNICTQNTTNADQRLQITSNDETTEKSPFSIIRTYTIKDACGNIASAPQSITISDKINPVITGEIRASIISGNTEKNAPAAVRTVSELEAMGVSITDNCTTDPNLVVSSTDQILGRNPIIINRTYTVKDVSGNQAKITHKITIIDNNITPKTETLPINSNPLDKSIPDEKVTSPYSNKTTSVESVEKVLSPTLSKITYVDKATSPYFAIQLLALTERTNDLGFFKFVQYVRVFSCIDGYHRYVVGRFETFEEANLYLSRIHSLSSKYKGAFVVNTAKFKLKESSISTKPISLPIKTTATQSDINTDKIKLIYTGTLETLTISGCSLRDLPAAVKTVAELEDMGITITNKCTLDKNTVVTSSDRLPTGNCPITIKRMYIIKDICGNIATIPQTINIIDKMCPVITDSIKALNLEGCLTKDVPPAVKTIEELEALGVLVSDNCTANSFLVLRSSDAPPVGYCPVTIIRTYIVSDACGNETSKTQAINKKDTVLPIITGSIKTADLLNYSEKIYPDAVKTIDELEALGVKVSDNCTPKANLTLSSSDVPSEDVYPEIITRTYFIKDACGNAATAPQIFTFIDSISPISPIGNEVNYLDVNKMNIFKVKSISVYEPNKLYTVQIMESEYPFYVTDFTEFSEVYEFYMPDKVFRYTYGKFNGTEVGGQLNKAQSIGYTGAKVVEWEEYLPYKIE